jgi:hypothetical protein
MRRSRALRIGLVSVLAAAAVVTSAGPALAKGGEVGGSGAQYFMSNTFSTTADIKFTYGRADDHVYVGDWDGNGTDTLAIRRGATYYFSNSNSGGKADKVLTYGRPGDVVLVGDWNGDGKDTLAVRRGSQYFIKNSLTGGKADKVLIYGRTGDVVLVGDWNGDGTDSLAVRRGSQYFIKNSLSGGKADTVVTYGHSEDVVLVGDWNGDGSDTLAVRRGSQYFIKNSLVGGGADLTVVFGRATDTTLVGDWNGDGTASLAIRRPATSPPSSTPVPAAQSSRSKPFKAGTITILNSWLATVEPTNTNAYAYILSHYDDDTPPAPGDVYVLTGVDIGYIGSGSALPWLDLNVGFVGGDGLTYTDTVNLYWPDNIYNINEMYNGAVARFVTIVEVPSSAVPGGRWRIDDTSDFSNEQTAWYGLS